MKKSILFLSTAIGVFVSSFVLAEASQALTITIDQLAQKVTLQKLDGSKRTYKAVTPKRNQSHLIPVGEYTLGIDYLPWCNRQTQSLLNCQKNNNGFAMPKNMVK
ncbi:MAG: hypothetical protein HC932_03825 [Thermales bacterium]|nr:hypothetical protein [Thermales bacterium]